MRVQECIVSIPGLNLTNINYLRPQTVEHLKAAAGKLPAPILIRLFIDVKFPALSRNRSRKQYYVTMSNEIINENVGIRNGDVLRDLKALHEIKATPKSECLGKVDGGKSLLGDQPPIATYIIAIYSYGVFDAVAAPLINPNPTSAANIQYTGHGKMKTH
jgi:hypothetical protein